MLRQVMMLRLGRAGTARRPGPWVVGVALAVLVAGGPAQAWNGRHGHWNGRHGHWGGSSVGVVIGVPPAWPYYGLGSWPYRGGGLYGWPYYAAPPAVVVERTPPVYVERGSAAADDDGGEGWWHYCRKPEGYYPYVKKCPGGWETVAPNPSE
jgi:hypothetical protein